MIDFFGLGLVVVRDKRGVVVVVVNKGVLVVVVNKKKGRFF